MKLFKWNYKLIIYYKIRRQACPKRSKLRRNDHFWTILLSTKRFRFDGFQIRIRISRLDSGTRISDSNLDALLRCESMLKLVSWNIFQVIMNSWFFVHHEYSVVSNCYVPTYNMQPMNLNMFLMAFCCLADNFRLKLGSVYIYKSR